MKPQRKLCKETPQMKASLRPAGTATAALTSLPLIASPASGLSPTGNQLVNNTHVGGLLFEETLFPHERIGKTAHQNR